MTQTHHIAVSGTTLTKRFTSWDRGEHIREWTVLRAVHPYEPDLVPRPVAADLDADPPWVTMSVVPGEPLAGVLSDGQLNRLVDAINALWAVPPGRLLPGPACLDFARRLTSGPRPAGGLEAEAFDAALAWWGGSDPDLLAGPPERLVIGHGDPNLANYLWDGRCVRIVDFEDAGLSDPANELAILAEHMSARALDADALCTRFDVDGVRLRAARRAWAMFWMRLLLPGGPAARRNPPEAVKAQARRLLDLLGDD